MSAPRWIALAVVLLVGTPVVIVIAVVALLTAAQRAACATLPAAGPPSGGGGGRWLATAYGPPWDQMNGSGMTATGVDLTNGRAALEIAVDPRVVALRSFQRVWPNPFGTHQAFYAGDTGGAIQGRHVDIYDWRGRSAQNAWGVRHVQVTPAPDPGAGNLLGEITPTAAGGGAQGTGGTSGCPIALAGPLQLTAGPLAQILPDGSAAAPADAPAQVKAAIAAANQIHAFPYPSPDVHYGTLAQSWPAYDCSGSVSYVLYRAGLHSQSPETSGSLEAYGDPGPGQWITLYANSQHTWIVIAGLAFDTADFGGPNVPAGSGPRWRGNPLGNLADGLAYVVRHPPGL